MGKHPISVVLFVGCLCLWSYNTLTLIRTIILHRKFKKLDRQFKEAMTRWKSDSGGHNDEWYEECERVIDEMKKIIDAVKRY